MNILNRRSRRHRRLFRENRVLRHRLDELEHELAHDQLCPALLNRRGLDQAAKALAERVIDGDSVDYWVGVVDLDQFKQVNDSFGHAFGDTVIQAAGDTLQRILGGQPVARLGGDEFAFLTDGAGHTCLYANPLTVEVDLPGSWPRGDIGGRHLAVTMSIGLTAFNPGVPFSHLKHAADLAMYDAKTVTGRSSLVVHSSDRGVAPSERPDSRVRDLPPLRTQELA
jgi:diguanylate cyclase